MTGALAGRGRGREGRPWRRLRARILRANDICWICGQPGADSIDHVVPLSKGGHPTDLANLRPAHLIPCNRGRGVGDVPVRKTMPTSRRW